MSIDRYRDKAGGFSLMELLVALAILAIISSIAVPSYQQHLRKSRLTDAVHGLMDLASRLERYYTENNTYATATIGAAAATDVLASASTSGGFYTLSIISGDTSATAFSIKATAVGAQASDTTCGDFTLSDIGVRSVSGSGGLDDCW